MICGYYPATIAILTYGSHQPGGIISCNHVFQGPYFGNIFKILLKLLGTWNFHSFFKHYDLSKWGYFEAWNQILQIFLCFGRFSFFMIHAIFASTFKILLVSRDLNILQSFKHSEPCKWFFFEAWNKILKIFLKSGKVKKKKFPKISNV